MSLESPSNAISEENISNVLISSEKMKKKTKLEKYLNRKENRKIVRKAQKKRKRDRRDLAIASGAVQPFSIARPNAVSMKESDCHTRIVLDCSFDHIMSFKDICKLAHQISACYSINRRLQCPVQLYVTGLGSVAEALSENEIPHTQNLGSQVTATQPNPNRTLSRLSIVNAENWDIFLKSENFSDLFPASEIVYLCAESAEELPDTFAKSTSDTKQPSDEAAPSSVFTTDDIYVIGGLVDHNSHVGYCYEQAMKNQYRTARLPFDRAGVQMTGRRVLSVVHVFQALVGVFSEGKDWTASLNAAIPPRKSIIPQTVPIENPSEIIK